jgi:hypothetical protein
MLLIEKAMGGQVFSFYVIKTIRDHAQADCRKHTRYMHRFDDENCLDRIINIVCQIFGNLSPAICQVFDPQALVKGA